TFLKASNMRQTYTEVNNMYVNSAKMVIDKYDINIKQHPRKISAEVEMHAEALKGAEIFTFSLNPGFVVSQVMENSKELAFTRDHQILLIDFGREIMLGDKVNLTLKYEGVIDEGFSY